MCGLAGIVQSGLHPEDWRHRLEAMTGTLVHRGPDDHGLWFDAAAGVGLGHQRLSIIDLSQAGHQPMASPDGRLRIAYNGEIYNFRELRRELEGAGHRFRGHSDTEVILAAVAAWGLERAVGRMNGMFAFALWDAGERRLHLVRDRLGEKPLYYGRVGDAFAFASELQALRRVPGFSAEIDRRSLSFFVRHGYVPAPRSIYAGISKLGPGTILSVAAPAAEPAAPRAYWDPSEVVRRAVSDRLDLSPDEAVEELDRVLRSSVSRRLVADVPLGAFLSGGVDSSTVVALMQAAGGGRARTFTIGFGEAGYDESPFARRVARHLGTDHTELHVGAQEALEVVPRLPEIYHEPLADSSQIPTYLVARLARQHVKVCLSGDGGDELFGGYERYRIAAALWRRAGWVPVGLRRAFAGLLRSLPTAALDAPFAWIGPIARRHGRPGRTGDRVKKLAEILRAEDEAALYRRLVSSWNGDEELVRGLEREAILLGGSERRLPGLERVERMMLLDLVTYLPDDILAKVDRAAMAVSLETRLPLLDPEVVELAWRLPPRLRNLDGRGKWPLRRVLERYLPADLVERPKRGFTVPLASWLRGPLRDWAESLLDEGRLEREGYLRPAPIRRRWREHLSGERDWRSELWAVLVFEQWLEAQRALPGSDPGGAPVGGRQPEAAASPHGVRA